MRLPVSFFRLSLKQRKLLDQKGQFPLKLTGPAYFLLAQNKDNDSWASNIFFHWPGAISTGHWPVLNLPLLLL